MLLLFVENWRKCIVYVVKAGQRHIVIDIARTKEREMYVAMAADNSLSIQHTNTNTDTDTNTNTNTNTKEGEM